MSRPPGFGVPPAAAASVAGEAAAAGAAGAPGGLACQTAIMRAARAPVAWHPERRYSGVSNRDNEGGQNRLESGGDLGVPVRLAARLALAACCLLLAASAAAWPEGNPPAGAA